MCDFIRDKLSAILFYIGASLLTVNYKLADSIARLALRVGPDANREDLRAILNREGEPWI